MNARHEMKTVSVDFGLVVDFQVPKQIKTERFLQAVYDAVGGLGHPEYLASMQADFAWRAGRTIAEQVQKNTAWDVKFGGSFETEVREAE